MFPVFFHSFLQTEFITSVQVILIKTKSFGVQQKLMKSSITFPTEEIGDIAATQIAGN